MTHFRPEPSGSPGTSTLLTTTISGARAAPRPCPRPPAAATCRRAAPAGTAQPPSAGRAASAAQHPLPPRHRAAAPPRETRRASAAEQEASSPRRRGAGPALPASGSLSAAAFFPSGSVAALLVPGLRPGRRRPLFKLVLRPFPPPPRLAPRPPPLSRPGCAGARVGPCCVSARGSPQGRGAERPPRAPLRGLPGSSARLPPQSGARRSPDLAGTAAHPEPAATTATVHRWYRQWPSSRPMCS